MESPEPQLTEVDRMVLAQLTEAQQEQFLKAGESSPRREVKRTTPPDTIGAIGAVAARAVSRLQMVTEETVPEPPVILVFSVDHKQPVAEHPARVKMGMNGEVALKRFDNYFPTHPTQVKAKGMARKWIESFDPSLPDCGVPGLCFYSPESSPGIGKTHLMFAIGNALLAGGFHDIKVCTLKGILDTIKNNFGKSADDSRYCLEQYLNPRVILLDDCGKEATPSEWALSELFEIVDHWATRKTRVIRTTNDDAATAIKKYGAPVVSRFMELCGGQGINMDGEDYRRRKDVYGEFYGNVNREQPGP